MSDVIACPDPTRRAPARIVDCWTFGSTSGPVEHVKTGCERGHWFLTPTGGGVAPPPARHRRRQPSPGAPTQGGTMTATTSPRRRSDLPDVEVGGTTLPALVLERAAGLGDKPALVDATSGRTLSYRQLAEVNAAGLAARGFTRGDVLAPSPNLPEYALAAYGAAGRRRRRHWCQPAAHHRGTGRPAR